MSFDREGPDKIVDVKKRTTKVNIWMVVGVLLFFAIGACLVWRFDSRPPQHVQDVQQPALKVP